MKKALAFLRLHARLIITAAVSLLFVSALLLYKLGSLTGGLSATEITAAHQVVGWHGILQNPLYLPLKLVRSVIFSIQPDHGQTLTRLPSVVFGALTMLSFAALTRLWHGTRTALFASLLFAMSAWALHASRLASFDVLYLWTIPTLLLVLAVLQRWYRKPLVRYGSMLVLGLLLYIPGVIWLLIPSMYAYRRTFAASWRECSLLRQRATLLFAGLIWLPLLIYKLATNSDVLRTWLGLPQHFPTLQHLAKNIVAVPVHLLVRGPQYPEIWLAKQPILDLFTLLTCILGIYFYARHVRSSRTKLLSIYLLIGIVLIALQGPVGLSLLVPVMYLLAATGLTYLLHEWLQTFPVNPLARSIGIGLIAIAVLLSCVFNSRAYFVAWPNNVQTRATFHNHL